MNPLENFPIRRNDLIILVNRRILVSRRVESVEKGLNI